MYSANDEQQVFMTILKFEIIYDFERPYHIAWISYRSPSQQVPAIIPILYKWHDIIMRVKPVFPVQIYPHPAGIAHWFDLFGQIFNGTTFFGAPRISTW